MQRLRRSRFLVAIVAFLNSSSFVPAEEASLPTVLGEGFVRKADKPTENIPARQLREDRLATLAVSQILFEKTDSEIQAADLSVTAGDAPFTRDDSVVCKFFASKVLEQGRSPKFFCILQNGEEIKVKYELPAEPNGEVQSETAGSRLFTAIGVPADLVYMPKIVRCFGCPADPFKYHKHHRGTIDYTKWRDFHKAAIEVKYPGKNMESEDGEGFDFSDLEKTPAPRAHKDAIILLAVFTANADSRKTNNKLVCAEGYLDKETHQCSSGIAYMHDLGAMFGGHARATLKYDAEGWARAPLWSTIGGEKCFVDAPKSYWNPSIHRTQISREGRELLVRLLGNLSDTQIEDLFENLYARDESGNLSADDQREADRFVQVFKERRDRLSACGRE